MALAENVSNLEFTIEGSIQQSACWYDDVTGLDAEDVLKGKKAYTYLLRAGEKAHNYYVSFVEPSGFIKHQPIAIKYFGDAWFCRNWLDHGPYTIECIQDIVHRLMHCEKEEAQPLNKM